MFKRHFGHFEGHGFKGQGILIDGLSSKTM